MDIRFVVEQTAGLTVIYALSAVIAWALHRNSAASRHMVWWLAAVAALMLPAASLLKPAGTPGVLVAPVQTGIVVAASGQADAVPGGGAIDVLAAVWLTGLLFTLGRLVTGIVRSTLRRRRATPSDIPVNRAGVDVRISDRIAVPETFGALRPVILLPVEATNWTPERLRIVLAHELVHVERRDWLTQLVAQFSACVYWFHPLAWYTLAQMRREREIACDDGVLRLGYKNSDYAQHLVEVARSVRTHTEMLAPSVAMAAQSQLETRVRAILNPARNRADISALLKTVLAAAAVLGVFLLSSAGRADAAGTRVSGVVKNASSAVVPKAFVVLAGTGEGSRTIATWTRADGEWEVSAEPGKYRLEIRKPGFRLYQHEVTVDYTPARIESTVEVGTLQETINVQGETTVPAPQAGTPPQRIRVGGNVQAAKLIRMERPPYPQHLKDAGVTGTVVLQAVVGISGDIINYKVISPDEVHPDLVTAAVDAIKQWKYEPTRLNGEPVEVLTIITVNFDLSRN
jgi:TonB family protein